MTCRADQTGKVIAPASARMLRYCCDRNLQIDAVSISPLTLRGKIPQTLGMHEALIRNWPTLVEWVSRDRVFQLWLRQLRPRAEEWLTNPSDDGTLLRGGPLAVAEDWVARRGSELNPEEAAFITASIALRDADKLRAEQDLKQKQMQVDEMAIAQKKTANAQKITRWALGGFAIMLVMAGAELIVNGRSISEQQVDIQQLQDRLKIEQKKLEVGTKEIDLRMQALKDYSVEIESKINRALKGELPK
jgi:hypothetical protein